MIPQPARDLLSPRDDNDDEEDEDEDTMYVPRGSLEPRKEQWDKGPEESS